jgi:myo-inositol 2-dehydrogenase/D-chiro-inositol 1-dehydrogenase
VQDALEVAYIAEAASLSLREHRPVPVADLRP